MHIEWIKLVKFGEYAHAKGDQIFDEQAAHAIINSFRSWRGKLLRKFQGLPLYIGHPDDMQFTSRHNKVYGRIENIKIENRALWILVNWTDIGRELFKNNIIKYLSPRWLTTMTKDGKLSPKRLLSVGMTNHPNIKCDHVTQTSDWVANDIAALADVPILSTEAATVSAVPVEGLPSGVALEATQENVGVKAENFARETTTTDEEQIICQVAPDAVTTLPLNVTSRTQALQKNSNDKSDCEKILSLVYTRMQTFSEKYYDAWQAVKRSHPALFLKNF